MGNRPTMPSMPNSFFASAGKIQPETVALRRELHAHPEVGLHLPETRRRVLEALEGLPLDIVQHQTTSGIVAILRGDPAGPAVLLRGDMDALAMPEDTDLEFASRNPGVMHACGHDLHTAMLVGAARVLSNRQSELPGTVVFMFQPGEEGEHGARYMLEEGLLNTEPTPSGAFALHVTTMFEGGTVNHRPGPQLAAADEFHITITGQGGHASAPHLAVDPVPAAAEMILATQAAVTRRFSVFDPIVVTFGQLTAGTTHNVIPEVAHLAGTLRSLSERQRERAHAMLRRVVDHVASIHEVRSQLNIRAGYPVTVNDAEFAAFVSDVAVRLLGAAAVRPMRDPLMGAEDWSYVLQRVPGAMAFLGASPPDVTPGEGPNNHSNRVIFDEAAMVPGVAVYAAVAWEFLTRASQGSPVPAG